LNDLSEIVGYVAHDDFEAASRFGEALLDHVDQFGRFPRMGNVIRKRPGVRRLVIHRFWSTTRFMRRSA